ncbi:hypothetical protein EON65_02450 [archaeon]|nr:MAG: hypothetical protein EON65_02450 [archaeon]
MTSKRLVITQMIVHRIHSPHQHPTPYPHPTYAISISSRGLETKCVEFRTSPLSVRVGAGKIQEG